MRGSLSLVWNVRMKVLDVRTEARCLSKPAAANRTRVGPLFGVHHDMPGQLEQDVMSSAIYVTTERQS